MLHSFESLCMKNKILSNLFLFISSTSDVNIVVVCIQDIGVTEEPSADQTDLSASPPPPYVPPPPLSLSDITAHEPQDRLGHSDVAESLTSPVAEGDDQEGGTGFEFDDKDEDEVEDLSRATAEQSEGRDPSLEREECDADQSM